MPTFRIECTEVVKYVVYVEANTLSDAKAKVEVQIEDDGAPDGGYETDSAPWTITDVMQVEEEGQLAAIAFGARAACQCCGQDIEWTGEWRDRGGNRECVPYIADGEVVHPPQGSTHSPLA